MPRFSNNGFYNDEDLRKCLYCGNNADSKDHTPSRFLCKTLKSEQSRITVPCCKVCNNIFSAIELRCKYILEDCSNDAYYLTYSQISDLRIISIKNAVGIIFHFYGVRLERNGNIEFSIVTNITESFFDNFIICNFDVAPSIELSLNPLLVFSLPNTDIKGIIRDNVVNIGETVIGYSNNPFCVKFLYNGIIGFTVKWN